MMNILVTGSSGYIGNNLINKYKHLYRFYTFSLQHSSMEDIDFNGIDSIVHCAALVHQSIEHSYEKYYEVNVQYPLSLAKKAKENGVKHFVFLSTIAVYGETYEYIDENTKCMPSTYYGKSKLETEKKLQELSDDIFSVSIIRLPMIYGANAPGNIASLISIIQKTPLLPFDKINNKRTFLYIDNLLQVVELVLRTKQKGVFLIGDDDALSTTKLINLIATALNKKLILVKIPLFENCLKALKPSIHKRLYTNLEINCEKTKKHLGISSLAYKVEDAIKLMINGQHS